MSHRAGLSIGVRKSDPAQREIDCDPKLATVRGQLFQGDRAMRVILSTVSMAAALVATEVSAQSVNLTGRWQCVAFCVAPPGRYAFITQNGWEINVVNKSGVASRAWFNWPGRIWVERANEGAVYSPNGFTLQFDRGTVWQRAPELPPPLVRRSK